MTDDDGWSPERAAEPSFGSCRLGLRNHQFHTSICGDLGRVSVAHSKLVHRQRNGCGVLDRTRCAGDGNGVGARGRSGRAALGLDGETRRR